MDATYICPNCKKGVTLIRKETGAVVWGKVTGWNDNAQPIWEESTLLPVEDSRTNYECSGCGVEPEIEYAEGETLYGWVKRHKADPPAPFKQVLRDATTLHGTKVKQHLIDILHVNGNMVFRYDGVIHPTLNHPFALIRHANRVDDLSVVLIKNSSNVTVLTLHDLASKVRALLGIKNPAVFVGEKSGEVWDVYGSRYMSFEAAVNILDTRRLSNVPEVAGVNVPVPDEPEGDPELLP